MIKPNNPNRRSFFFAGMGASILSLISTPSRAANSEIIWVNGVNGLIVGEDEPEIDIVENNVRILRGNSWSDIALHFAVPIPANAAIRAIRLRFKTDSGAKMTGLCIHDCERKLLGIKDMGLTQSSWEDVRIPLDNACNIVSSLGVTLHFEFADTERQFKLGALGCEFEMRSVKKV